MLLILMFTQPDKEIAGCISDIGVPFTATDLQKPNPQHIQMVFEHLGELLMNATRESIDPAMRAAADDICGNEFPELIPSDTRNLMAFFVSLRRLIVECGVNDFSFSDLVRPTHERLGKIFSYIINFVRFRESQTATIDENFNKAEATKSKIEELYMENQEMAARLDEMKRNRKAMEVAVKEKSKRNDELKSRLLELRKGQEKVSEQLERAKADKTRSQSLLEEKTERLGKIRLETEKLRPYVLQSSAALQGTLEELSDNLAKDKTQIDVVEKRSRALQTSSDAFSVVHNDVQSCVKVLEDIAVELQKEEEEEARASRNREALSERSNNVREIEQNEKVLDRQLKRWEERTDELKRKHKDREDIAKAKLEELRGVQKQLREERADKGRDMERKRVRIEQTEKKVCFDPQMTLSCVRKLTYNADGRSEREHRERSTHCDRGVSETRVSYQTVRH